MNRRGAGPVWWWVIIGARLVLGVVFVVAAARKIADPPAFAQAVSNYRILPVAAVHLVALWVPWIEMLTGLALVVGLWTRETAGLAGALLVVFVIGVGVNLARGRAIDCGCFGDGSEAKSRSELLAGMRWTIARDLGLLALAVATVWPRPTRPG